MTSRQIKKDPKTSKAKWGEAVKGTAVLKLIQLFSSAKQQRSGPETYDKSDTAARRGNGGVC